MVRSILRNIARNRMKDMGLGDVNTKMHMRFGDKSTMPDKEAIPKLQKTPQGRDRLAKAMKEHPALWQEVLWGSRKKEANTALARMATRRKMERHPDNPEWPKKPSQEKQATE